MSDFYHSPEMFGLETVGEIEWSDGNYQFDLTVVWRRTADGAFLYGKDSGCSCPTPFDEQGIDDLKPIASLSEFQADLNKRNAEGMESGYRPDCSDDIARLLERLHSAGAR